jgi:hypothetical protein
MAFERLEGCVQKSPAKFSRGFLFGSRIVCVKPACDASNPSIYGLFEPFLLQDARQCLSLPLGLSAFLCLHLGKCEPIRRRRPFKRFLFQFILREVMFGQPRSFHIERKLVGIAGELKVARMYVAAAA